MIIDKEKSNSLLLNTLKDDLPLVLFVGQNYLSNEGEYDNILKLLLKKLGQDEKLNWSDVLRNGTLKEDNLQWLTERFAQQSLSESTIENFTIAWSAVFTTSIDPRITKLMQTLSRHPETIVIKDTNPQKTRSKYNPPIYYLFSKVDEDIYIIPLDEKSLLKRKKQHVDKMLTKLTETVTSLGLLVLEGFSINDSLEVDEFLASIPEESGFKILWCGLKEKPDSCFFDEYLEKGFITYDDRSLSEIINGLKSEALLPKQKTIINDDAGVLTIEREKFLNISPSLRLRVEASAFIIDDSWTDYVDIPNNQEDDFRKFHGNNNSLRKQFDGVVLGYSIKREFEEKLTTNVINGLKKGVTKDRVFILHGQTSTGKSTALIRLALKLRKEQDFKSPILYAINKIPNLIEIDAFCSEVENQSNAITVVICDANTPATYYYDLANGLHSRGRKALIIGTSYSLGNSDNFGYIKAPSEVTQKEQSDIKSLINKYMSNSKLDDSFLDNNNILAMLYRLLNVSRPSILDGLGSETRATELMLRERSSKIPISKNINTKLSEQLINAGLCDNNELSILDILETDKNNNNETITTMGKLIDYVMAVGHLNCFIPINLLIRTLINKYNSLSLDQLYYIFKDIDLFRWHYDDEEETELFIGPRIQLEAELICRRRLADRDKELECFLDLIENVRIDTVDKNAEQEFLSKLLIQLDKEGMYNDKYAYGYLKIAETLTKLRLDIKIEEPSFMLRESSFRRAYLRDLDSNNIYISDVDRNKILNDARESVEHALDIFKNKNKKNKTYEFLLVERASIYGYLAVAISKQDTACTNDIWSNYEASKVAVNNALLTFSSYFPVDVALWTSMDILKNATLEDTKTAELHANIFYMLDQVDKSSLPPSQLTNFEKQRMRVANVIGNKQMEQDALKSLEEINPAVAFYLQARNICPEIFEEQKTVYDNNIIEKAKEAYKLLEKNKTRIQHDERCIILTIEYLWIITTERRLFRNERQPIPADNEVFLNKLQSLLVDLHDATSGYMRNVFRYLEAVVLWLKGDEIYANDIWSILEKETEYEDATRIIKRLFISDNNLNPKTFSGRLKRKISGNRWIANITELRQEVIMIETDFPNYIFEAGKEINNFAVSFNYLGAIADARLEIKK